MKKISKYILILFVLISGITNVNAYNKNFSKYVKPSEATLKKTLTTTQYTVTQKDWTETPYKNLYRDNHSEGIYVDVVSGEPLFSSNDKYDSKTWRPSFTKPISKSVLATKEDKELWFVRTEVRSKYSNSHLGHVFDDWPTEKWWMRYCINSASIKFIPKKNLKSAWYEKYIALFK